MQTLAPTQFQVLLYQKQKYSKSEKFLDFGGTAIQ